MEAGWAGFTLDMKENVRLVGKLLDFGDVEIVSVGHGEPIPEGGIELLKWLREQRAWSAEVPKELIEEVVDADCSPGDAI